MLFSVGVTPLMTKTTRRCQQQGAEADGRSHNEGHCCRQQKTVTTIRRQQRRLWWQFWYINNKNNYGTPTVTIAIIEKRLTLFFSLTVSKNNNKEWSVALSYQIFFVLDYQKKCCVRTFKKINRFNICDKVNDLCIIGQFFF